MNKNIAIISFGKYSSLNYGALLHPFAFQKYLYNKNIDSIIIDYKNKSFSYFMPHLPIAYAIKNNFSLKGFILGLLKQPSASIRFRKILRFSKDNYKSISNNGKPFTQKLFENNNEIAAFDFDCIVCESDVIWSPLTSRGFDRAFFADYVCFKGMKKVAYSASISNTILTEVQEQEFKKLILNYDFLSSREKETAKYVQYLIHKDCQYVLDPTLLLDEVDYSPIVAEIKEKKKYLLCYNCECNDKLMVRKAKSLARKMNLTFIEISMNINNKFYHRVLTTLSVEEWLGYFKNAEFIVTNGFHGMCFSIIFKKNFYVYKRGAVDLKFNLANELGLKENLITHDMRENDLERTIIDYEKVYFKINELKKISEEFICKAIIE